MLFDIKQHNWSLIFIRAEVSKKGDYTTSELNNFPCAQIPHLFKADDLPTTIYLGRLFPELSPLSSTRGSSEMTIADPQLRDEIITGMLVLAENSRGHVNISGMHLFCYSFCGVSLPGCIC